MLAELPYWGVERVKEMRVEGMETMVLFLKLILQLLDTKESEEKNVKWLVAGWLRKWRWQMEVENLYSYFSPSITAGLSDPAHFILSWSSFPGPPPSFIPPFFPSVYSVTKEMSEAFLPWKKKSHKALVNLDAKSFNFGSQQIKTLWEFSL